eukprot:362004-Chlamydomonas_euryale.AAC.2
MKGELDLVGVKKDKEGIRAFKRRVVNRLTEASPQQRTRANTRAHTRAQVIHTSSFPHWAWHADAAACAGDAPPCTPPKILTSGAL